MWFFFAIREHSVTLALCHTVLYTALYYKKTHYLDVLFVFITIYFISKILKTLLKYHSYFKMFWIENHINIFYTAVLVINCSCQNVKWQSVVLSSVMFNGRTLIFSSGTFTSGLFVRGRLSAGDKREICLHVRSEACAGFYFVDFTRYWWSVRCSTE